MKLTRRALLASGIASLALPRIAMAADGPIKVGVLHSLSGTMAISESTLKDTVLMPVSYTHLDVYKRQPLNLA